jgi:cytochrome c peroxidase
MRTLPRRACILLLGGAAAACQSSDQQSSRHEPSPMAAPTSARSATIEPTRLRAFAPLPATMEAPNRPTTEARVTLGRMLYYDTRLSAGRELSCDSCHRLAGYGVDNERLSPGHGKRLGKRNSPTVYNAAGHFAQFWDGRAADVEEQAKGPILNPREMAMPDAKSVVKAVKAAPRYAPFFKEAFPSDQEPITLANISIAIGAFERRLTTPSRWDAFLRDDAGDVLTSDERRGFNAFVDTGCSACHAGVYVGGAMFQKIGLVVPWPDARDAGRFEVTKQESDRLFFKVPGLRNVEKTAPYFHDGSVGTLPEAVMLMAHHQLGRDLDSATLASIVNWLKSLTGQPDKEYIARPALSTR